MHFDDPLGELPEYLSNDEAAAHYGESDWTEVATKAVETLIENADDIIAAIPGGDTKPKKPKAAKPGQQQQNIVQQPQVYYPAKTGMSAWQIVALTLLAGGAAYGGWWAYNRYWRR